MTRPESTADILFDMRRDRRIAASLPPHAIPASLDEAYCAQGLLIDRVHALRSGRTIGYKVAATSLMAQKLLKIPAPIFGLLLSETTHRSPASLPAGDFTVRCIEAEFGFEIGADLAPTGVPYTRESVVDSISALIPSIEIVDHRYDDWAAVGAESLIADNAIHGAWIEGDPVTDWRHLDLAAHPVKLFVNGSQFDAGSGAAVLGHPLNVVAWLANELPQFGRQLRRGDKITTGITTAIYLAAPGDHLVADFDSLGRAELTFTPLSPRTP